MATNNAINLNGSGIVSYDGAGTFSALANPLIVSNGGTGVSSMTAYAVLCGGTTSTNPIQSIASVGTAAQVLTSNGAGALPTFQTAPAGFGQVIYWNATNGNLLDGSLRYLSNSNQGINVLSNNTDALMRMMVGQSGTINIIYGVFIVAGTLGSAETMTLSIIVNSTSYVVSSSLTLSSATNTFNNTSLAIPVTAGDFISMKLQCPTWATNPTNTSFSATLLIQ